MVQEEKEQSLNLQDTLNSDRIPSSGKPEVVVTDHINRFEREIISNSFRMVSVALYLYMMVLYFIQQPV